MDFSPWLNLIDHSKVETVTGGLAMRMLFGPGSGFGRTGIEMESRKVQNCLRFNDLALSHSR
jgi:hypothetical protein